MKGARLMIRGLPVAEDAMLDLRARPDRAAPGLRKHVTPVFLFSLPRSGSTLLQRILAGSEGVATATEPWLLFPFLYSMRADGVVAEYRQDLMVSGIEDFARQLPGGSDEYWGEIAELARRLYTRAAGDAQYFVDKTPSYSLICDGIVDLFPDAKFVFLWRNPLAVVASINRTWHGGRWWTHRWRSVIEDGSKRLATTYQRVRDRAVAVRYEDIVRRPQAALDPVFAYLGLDGSFDGTVPDVPLLGRHGDKTGREWHTLHTEPVDRWRHFYNNSARRAWARRYLSRLGDDVLAIMGYDRRQLEAEMALGSGTGDGIVSDAAMMAYEELHTRLERMFWNNRQRTSTIYNLRRPIRSVRTKAQRLLGARG